MTRSVCFVMDLPPRGDREMPLGYQHGDEVGIPSRELLEGFCVGILPTTVFGLATSSEFIKRYVC